MVKMNESSWVKGKWMPYTQCLDQDDIRMRTVAGRAAGARPKQSRLAPTHGSRAVRAQGYQFC